eukprot:gb/GFBE01022920.1/.p1 GENE.gb/GFBE01022920.1/~~gb/GFBE01022920.1/.p1  ORF type:complete len:360 (+),score=78.17 gb/GFBE01022920.1/:1-1080(+)
MFTALLTVISLTAGTCNAVKVHRAASDDVTFAEPVVKRGKLAIAISGGLRGFDQCAQSQIDAFVKPNAELFESIDIFVATWNDRGCMRDGMPVESSTQPTQELVQEVYSAAGHAVKNMWMGNHATYHEYHRKPAVDGKWPYAFRQQMLDNSHDMWILWQALMSMITPDYDAIIRLRPDLCFSDGYKVQLRQTSDASYVALLVSPFSLPAYAGKAEGTRTEQQTLEIPLEKDSVYMGANMFHADAYNHTSSTIPDDMVGFGLYAPMEGVFGTMFMHADAGMFNVTDEEYSRFYGDPATETGHDTLDHPQQFVNPPGSWIRERYPEKALKHQILRSGYRYALIEDAWFNPYYTAAVKRDCA